MVPTRYMLLAGRSGGAGRCGGLCLALKGSWASGTRIGLAGSGVAGAQRFVKDADTWRMNSRMSMGLLLKGSPQ